MDASIPPGVKLLDVLKRGLGVDTWLAERLGTKVVLKQAALDQQQWASLVCELEALQRLSVPQVAGLIEFGYHGGKAYLIQEYCPGQTLAQRLESGPLDESEFFELARRLLSVLIAVHDAGVVHRDIKPSNLIVGEGDLRLIDFGLSTVRQSSASAVEVGSVLYAAPEASGLLKADAAEGTDFYSVGATLYHALTGQPPYQGTRANEVLRMHVDAPIPSPRAIRPELSEHYDTFFIQILAKHPDSRYSSAAEALNGIGCLERGEVVPLLTANETGRLARPAFVGRQKLLDQICQTFPRGGLFMLTGPSGGGKSRLLDKLATEAFLRQATVYRGYALPDGASSGWQLLAEPLYHLFSGQSLTPPIAAMVDFARDDLVRLMPFLEAFLGPSELAEDGELHARERVVQTVAAVFNALPQPTRPVVILLDDVQWIDPFSLDVLGQLARLEGNTGLTILACAREGQIPIGLESWGQTITLEPLSSSETQELLHSMAGQCPSSVLGWVDKYAEGNPLLVVEGMRGLAHRFGRPQEWPEDFSAFQVSDKMARALTARIQALGSEGKEVLTMASVLGRTFRITTLQRMVDRPLPFLLDIMHQARKQKLLWADSSGQGFSLAHDKIREFLLGGVSLKVSELHFAAAAALVEDPKSSDWERAYHYLQASQPQAARPYALRAAEQARSQLQFAKAAQACKWALQAEFEYTLGYTHALMLCRAGRPQEALDYFESLLPHAPSARCRAEVFQQLGELALSLSRVQESIGYFEQAILALGGPLIRQPGWLQMLTLLCSRIWRGKPVRPTASGGGKDEQLWCRSSAPWDTCTVTTATIDADSFTIL